MIKTDIKLIEESELLLHANIRLYHLLDGGPSAGNKLLRFIPTLCSFEK